MPLWLGLIQISHSRSTPNATTAICRFSICENRLPLLYCTINCKKSYKRRGKKQFRLRSRSYTRLIRLAKRVCEYQRIHISYTERTATPFVFNKVPLFPRKPETIKKTTLSVHKSVVELSGVKSSGLKSKDSSLWSFKIPNSFSWGKS